MSLGKIFNKIKKKVYLIERQTNQSAIHFLKFSPAFLSFSFASRLHHPRSCYHASFAIFLSLILRCTRPPTNVLVQIRIYFSTTCSATNNETTTLLRKLRGIFLPNTVQSGCFCSAWHLGSGGKKHGAEKSRGKRRRKMDARINRAEDREGGSARATKME